MPDRKAEALSRAVELIRALYALNGVGGYAHIVTDDLNVSDADVRWCLNACQEGQWDAATTAASRAVLEALLPMSRTQRLKAIHRARAEG